MRERTWPVMWRAVLMWACLGGAAAQTTAAAAATASYPERPINIVVPYSPGSGADLIARAVGPVMSRKLGQAVIVDNRAGASGTIGTASVARALPDGHTLLMSADAMTMAPALYRKLPFDTARDLIPVGRAALGTLVLAVHPDVQARSVAELVAILKKRPGELFYASPGNGTPQHVLMELFKQSTGTQAQHVPYKGMSGAVTDLIGGQVQLGVMSLQVAISHVASGRLRLLAVADDQRLASSHTVPTFAEAGYAELSHPNWFGLFAPVNTPGAVVSLLNSTLLEALKEPAVQDALLRQGIRVSPGTAPELARQVTQDLQRWSGVIAKVGITAD